MIKVELKGTQLTLCVGGSSNLIANELHALSEQIGKNYGEEHPDDMVMFAAAFLSGFSPKVLDKLSEELRDEYDRAKEKAEKTTAREDLS